MPAAPRLTGDPGAPLLEELLLVDPPPPPPEEPLLVAPPLPPEELLLLAPPLPVEVPPDVAALSLLDDPQAAASIANTRYGRDCICLIGSFISKPATRGQRRESCRAMLSRIRAARDLGADGAKARGTAKPRPGRARKNATVRGGPAETRQASTYPTERGREERGGRRLDEHGPPSMRKPAPLAGSSSGVAIRAYDLWAYGTSPEAESSSDSMRCFDFDCLLRSHVGTPPWAPSTFTR